MSRQGLIVSGAAIMVIGIVVTAVSYSATSEGGGGGYVVAWGAIAVGLFRVVRGMAARDDPPPGPRPDEDQMRGRHGPSEEGPQIAGSKCVHCGEKILSTIEGTACRLCRKAVHLDCRKDHRAKVHTKEAGVAAR